MCMCVLCACISRTAICCAWTFEPSRWWSSRAQRCTQSSEAQWCAWQRSPHMKMPRAACLSDATIQPSCTHSVFSLQYIVPSYTPSVAHFYPLFLFVHSPAACVMSQLHHVHPSPSSPHDPSWTFSFTAPLQSLPLSYLFPIMLNSLGR